MKLRKVMAGIVASAVATSSLAVASSALLYVPEETHGGCIPGSGAWLVQVYNTGNAEEGKPATKYDIDLAAIDGIRFTIGLVTDVEKDEFAESFDFEGAFGGAVIMSVNGGDIVKYDDPDDPFAAETEVYSTYNWVPQYYWGGSFTDAEGNEISTDPLKNDDPSDDGSNTISSVAIGDNQYTITATGFVNPLSCTTDAWEIDEIGCFQICLHDYASDATRMMEVLKCEVLDASGNVIITFDGLGNPTVGSTQAPETDAPATDAPATDAPATDAPATDAPATQAPVTGDSSKPNAGTGVEGIALVAGIAVLATGAIVVAKKRS